MLLAIIGFMPTEGVGAIGSMDCSPEDRKKMARRYVELQPLSSCTRSDLIPRLGSHSQTSLYVLDLIPRPLYMCVVVTIPHLTPSRSLDWVCPVCGIANRDLLPKCEYHRLFYCCMSEALFPDHSQISAVKKTQPGNTTSML